MHVARSDTGRGRRFLPDSISFPNDTKTVEAEETVTVPAGQFAAYRVARVATGPGIAIRTDQWFSPVGLVKVVDEVSSPTAATSPDGLISAGERTSSTSSTMVLERFSLISD